MDGFAITRSLLSWLRFLFWRDARIPQVPRKETVFIVELQVPVDVMFLKQQHQKADSACCDRFVLPTPIMKLSDVVVINGGVMA
jgi:hypothetical protein